MSKELITVFEDDKLYALDFTLQDSNGDAIDLTGSTVQMKVQKHGADTLKFTGSMTILSATAGTCRYTVADGDFDSDGVFYAEIVVTYPGGKIVTFNDFIFSSRKKLPK